MARDSDLWSLAGSSLSLPSLNLVTCLSLQRLILETRISPRTNEQILSHGPKPTQSDVSHAFLCQLLFDLDRRMGPLEEQFIDHDVFC